MFTERPASEGGVNYDSALRQVILFLSLHQLILSLLDALSVFLFHSSFVLSSWPSTIVSLSLASLPCSRLLVVVVSANVVSVPLPCVVVSLSDRGIKPPCQLISSFVLSCLSKCPCHSQISVSTLSAYVCTKLSIIDLMNILST